MLRGTLDRRSLALDVLHLPSQAERLAWLAQAIPTLPGTGIVYALTIDDARRVAAWLAAHGIAARAYTGDDPIEARLEVESMLQRNELKCVVATSALGMGYDKPDLAFVIHFQMPGSAIAYYQQVGRAGRAFDQRVRDRARSVTRIARSRTTSSTSRSRRGPTPSRWWRCSTRTSG